MTVHLQFLFLDLRAVAALGGAGNGDLLLDGRREVQREETRDGLRVFLGRAAGIVFAGGVNRHHHRLVVHHHGDGAGLRLGGRARRVNGGDRIGQIESLARLQRAGIEVLAQRGHHRIGVLCRDAKIFQHAGKGIAGVQRHGAAFHIGIGIGIVGIVCRALRLAGADQLHEQGVGQGGTARRDHRVADGHHANRHPGDGARHQRGEGGGDNRPAAVRRGHDGARAIQPAQHRDAECSRLLRLRHNLGAELGARLLLAGFAVHVCSIALEAQAGRIPRSGNLYSQPAVRPNPRRATAAI